MKNALIIILLAVVVGLCFKVNEAYLEGKEAGFWRGISKKSCQTAPFDFIEGKEYVVMFDDGMSTFVAPVSGTGEFLPLKAIEVCEI